MGKRLRTIQNKQYKQRSVSRRGADRATKTMVI